MKKVKSEKVKSNLNFRHFTFSLFLLFHFLTFFAFSASAQDLAQLSEQIRFGTTEIKRDTLFQIRNFRRADTSRVAVPALRDADEIVRATVAFAVIYLPKEEAFAALLPNLSDKADIVRRETAYALGAIEYPNAAAPLVALYETEKIAEVRNAAVVALGTTGNVSAVEILSKILAQKPKSDNEENEFLRRAAARSIGQIAQIIQTNESYTVTPENFLPEKYKPLTTEKYVNLSPNFAQFRNAVPVLIKVLQNNKETDDTRRESAFALGAIGDERAESVLRANLNASDNFLAEICKEALTKISTAKQG